MPPMGRASPRAGPRSCGSRLKTKSVTSPTPCATSSPHAPTKFMPSNSKAFDPSGKGRARHSVRADIFRRSASAVRRSMFGVSCHIQFLRPLQNPFLAVAAVCDRRGFPANSWFDGARRAPLQGFFRGLCSLPFFRPIPVHLWLMGLRFRFSLQPWKTPVSIRGQKYHFFPLTSATNCHSVLCQ